MSVGTETAVGVSRRAAMWKMRAWEGRLFAYPVVIGTLIFNILPVVPSVALSFMHYDMLTTPRFAGLANYSQLVTDREFYNGIQATLYYTIGHVPLALAAGLALALLVNQRRQGITWFRGLYFLPVITSTVAIAMTWRWMYSYQFGVINYILGVFGISGPAWLGDIHWAMPAVILLSVWQSMGYNMVIFLAGLQGVPPHLYEAAAIDGASGGQEFRHITLPLLTPTVFFLLIISVIQSFQVFGTVYIMTSGGPGSATAVYVYYLWQTAFQLFHMGYASAMAWILFMIIAVVTMVQWRLSERWVFYQ